MKVYAREAFLIPLNKIDGEFVEKAHANNTFNFYNDKNCERCPYFIDRPVDTCETCPNNLGAVRLTKVLEVQGRDFLSWPIGDLRGLKSMFPDGDVEVVPVWKDKPMKRQPNFTGKLKAFQKPATDDVIRGRRGILKSAPRTGKTVMGAYITCRLGLKTIILASQHDWLVNFYETFVGSKTQEPLTDISKKRIGYPKTLDEYEQYDVCLVTYQQFLSDKGKEKLKKIRRLFSVLLVDEVHKGNAKAFAKVISQFVCKYKIGLTGTPKRKDERHVIVKKLMGPILHETTTERLVPRVVLTKSPIASAKDYRIWAYMVRYLETHPQRMRLIAEKALHDVANDHLVLIPLSRVASIKALTMAINRLAGKDVAEAFYGGIPKDSRDKVIENARRYKTKVVVGNIKMLSTGINIPRASCLYQCTPTSNMPNAEQRFSRILTPWEGKPQPLIRVFADDMKVVQSCFRAEFWGALNKLFKPVMTEETREKLYAWMNGSKKSRNHIENHSGGLL